MADEDVITIKDRKLFYDDFHRGYYFESKIEALERASTNRFKKADAMNKNISLQMESANRHIGQAEHIFTSKCTREIGELRESLRTQVAYRKVLSQVAKDFELSPQNRPPGKYGTYGPDAYQKGLMPQLEAELKQMNPETRRRKEVKRLLRQRKQQKVFDRTLPDLLIMTRTQKRSNPDSPLPNSGDKTDTAGLDGAQEVVVDDQSKDVPEKIADSAPKERVKDGRKPAKLVLPPIQATMSPTKSRSPPKYVSESETTLTLPRVFVTEFEKTGDDLRGEIIQDGEKDRAESEEDILFEGEADEL